MASKRRKKKRPVLGLDQQTIAELKAAIEQAQVELGEADENVQAARTDYDAALETYADLIVNGTAAQRDAQAVVVIGTARALNAADAAFDQKDLNLRALMAALLFRMPEGE